MSEDNYEGENQPLPKCVEAERAVLGAILLNPASADIACDILNGAVAAFFDDRHRCIFGAIVRLSKRGDPVDTVTIMSQLSKDNSLEDAGGVSYLAGLASAVPTSANIEHYCELVRDTYGLRKIISACASVEKEAFRGETPPDILAERFNYLMSKANAGVDTGTLSCLEDGFEEAVDSLTHTFHQRDSGGIPTGIPNIDGLFYGFHPGELTTLAAAPGGGKTALAMNIASNLAIHGKTSLIFSMEMPGADLRKRIVAMRGGIATSRLISGLMGVNELSERLNKAMNVPGQRNLWMDDSMTLGVGQIAARARRFAATRKLDLIIIDYLQLIQSEGQRGENRTAEVGRMARSLKNLTGELHVPILVMSQISRDGSRDTAPQLYHLRESGEIEAHSNNVIMMWKGEGWAVNLAVRKQRSGPVGETVLYFNRATQLFTDGENVPKDSEPPPPPPRKKSADEIIDGILEPVEEPDEDEYLF